MTKRTKKQYQELYDNPSKLFNGLEVTLFPNGEKEIWIKDAFGGFRICASKGPHGIGLTISNFIGSTPMTLNGNTHPDYGVFTGPDMREVSLTEYYPTEDAQAFKQWYQKDSQNRPDMKVRGKEFKQ